MDVWLKVVHGQAVLGEPSGEELQPAPGAVLPSTAQTAEGHATQAVPTLALYLLLGALSIDGV